MSPVERLQAAIEKLQAIRDDVGNVVLSADGWLFARSDEDTDDDGEFFVYGLQVMVPGALDYEPEVARGLALLAGQELIDAQLAILRFAAEGRYDLPEFVALADAILREAS